MPYVGRTFGRNGPASGRGSLDTDSGFRLGWQLDIFLSRSVKPLALACRDLLDNRRTNRHGSIVSRMAIARRAWAGSAASGTNRDFAGMLPPINLACSHHRKEALDQRGRGETPLHYNLAQCLGNTRHSTLRTSALTIGCEGGRQPAAIFRLVVEYGARLARPITGC